MKVHIQSKNRETYDQRDWARTINSISGFKSANLVGTISKNGKTNLSIVSSVIHLGSAPPLIAFVLRPHSEDSPRHTFMNLSENLSYTLNTVTADIFQRAHQTSARYDRETSEFEACDLTPEFKPECLAPFVQESPLKIALKLREVKDIALNNTKFIIGEVTDIYLNQSALRKDGYIDLEAMKSVCISGLDRYHQTHNLGRLSYAKTDRPPQSLTLDGDTL